MLAHIVFLGCASHIAHSFTLFACAVLRRSRLLQTNVIEVGKSPTFRLSWLSRSLAAVACLLTASGRNAAIDSEVVRLAVPRIDSSNTEGCGGIGRISRIALLSSTVGFQRQYVSCLSTVRRRDGLPQVFQRVVHRSAARRFSGV